MEKENLDDLMREKFDTDNPGARFEFREEYWEQAQAMLEADERKRKRRFLWWWWLGAGCLLLAVGGWFWYTNPSGSGASGATQVTSQSTVNYGDNAQKNNELGEITTDRATKSAGSSSTGNSTDGLLAEPSTQPAGTTTTTASENARGDTELSKKTLATQAKSADETNRAGGLAKTPEATSGVLAGAEKSKGANSKLGRSGGADNSTSKAPAEAEILAENKFTTDSPMSQDDASAALTGLQPGMQNAPQPTGLSAETAAATGVAKTIPVVLPQILPIDFQALEPLSGIPFFPKATPVAREIKPLREPRLGSGVGAAASAFFPKNRAAQVDGTAGIFAAYRLSRSFSLSAGAAWRYIPMSGILADSAYEPQVSEQLRYSFGYKQLRTSIRPQGLHTLELPLTLRWHRGAWYLEGGASVSRLLGVRAEMVTDSSASLQPLPLTSKKKIWIDTQPYRQMWLSPMAGAGWQRGRWSVSLRAVLFPLDVAPPIVPDEPRATGWRPSVDIGLRYRIW